MFSILVVEDDHELNTLFCSVLHDNGYTTLSASNGNEALDIIEDTFVDLVVSDIMMPKMDGIELTKMLRAAHFTMPILMITAKESITDKMEGFRAGTDDYMVKPIDVNEMVYRIEALLRRSQIINQRKLKIGNTEFDCDTLMVKNGDAMIEIPKKEFFLLFKLVSSPNRIFTRHQIMDEIWGMDSETDTHTLDVHISRLRERLKDNPDVEIVTVRGLGYKAVKKHE